MSQSTPTAYISLPAIVHNYRACLRRAKGRRVICTVKADAYGHGALATARILLSSGATTLAVASGFEALSLSPLVKTALCKECFTYFKAPFPSLLILGTASSDELLPLTALRATLSVHSFSYAATVSKALGRLKDKGLLRADYLQPVAIKAETGMHRLGFDRFKEALAAVRLPHLLPVSVYSHLGEGDSASGRTLLQTHAFRDWQSAFLEAGYPLSSHLAASAALFRFGALAGDAVRVGIALYGTLPHGAHPELLPAMRLCARVLSVKRVPRGAGAGYGTLRLNKATRIAILGIGYADGLPLSATGARIWIKSTPCPIVGEVCMDRTLVDIGTLPLREGEEVTLFGSDESPPSRFAAECGVSVYRLLSVRSSRTQRVFVSS